MMFGGLDVVSLGHDGSNVIRHRCSDRKSSTPKAWQSAGSEYTQREDALCALFDDTGAKWSIDRHGFARLARVVVRSLLVKGVAPRAATTPLGKATALGTGTDPSTTVRVQDRPCGPTICGYVLFATDRAKGERRSQRAHGNSAVQPCGPDKPAFWKGKVFAPDIDKTFSDTMTSITRPAQDTRLPGFVHR